MKILKKIGKKRIIAILLTLTILIVFAVLYLNFLEKKPVKSSGRTGGGSRLVNPAEGLSLEEAIAKFDDKFVYYLLYNIKAYRLHNPPLSSNEPKIEIFVDEEAYSAIINDGRININNGNIEDKDIILRTTKEEAIKMMNDKNYVSQSFSQDFSSIELISSKLELFSKGYLDIYNELGGK